MPVKWSEDGNIPDRFDNNRCDLHPLSCCCFDLVKNMVAQGYPHPGIAVVIKAMRRRYQISVFHQNSLSVIVSLNHLYCRIGDNIE